ncbi:MAG: enoyl-CoA hydratase-related protein [Paracoccaceae bacterium]|nr:enoyl-CoA hydratase-related protein [Paracoccaceae bacterium]
MAAADQHVVRQVRHGAVLELVIDAPPVNALGHAVRAALAGAIAQAEADGTVKAVVIRAAGRTFPAGADIAEFGQPPRAPLLPDLCNQIEACTKPVIAAIHGTALGGGLELALAAQVRVARADARLGLPEVLLGILPGAGGTQRVPRLIGAEQALRLMLTGRPIAAAEALALGLVDLVVEDGLEAAALSMAEAVIGTSLLPTCARNEGMRDAPAYQAAVAAARVAQHASRLPAPMRIVECVEAAQLLPFDQGLAFERAAFQDLVASPEAQGLRHAFFAERAAAKMPEARATPRAHQVLCVVGAAGSGVALALMQAGYDVTLIEADRAALVGALEEIAAAQEVSVQAGRLSEPAREADWARLQPALGNEALGEADLVLVADAEAMLASVVQAARSGAVLVALTGFDAVGHEGPRAADLLGLDLDVPGGRIAEVIVGPATAPDAVATVLTVVRKLGRISLRTVAPGGVGARVAAAGRAAAAHLVARGLPEDEVAGALARFGMAGLAPVVGADQASHRDPVILSRCIGAMANEGARLVGQGVVLRPSDVDLAMVLGHGFPRWEGGPMHWADRRGLMILRRDLHDWVRDAPEIWGVAPLIDDLVAKGLSFGDMNAE